MGVVTVSTSAARSPLGLSAKLSTRLSQPRRPSALSFKTGKTKNATLVAPQKSPSLPMETSKTNEKQLRRAVRHAERVKVIALDQAAPSTSDLDYNEAAVKLEHIYKQSPATSDCDTELKDHEVKRGRQRRKVVEEDKEVSNNGSASTVVSKRSKSKRSSLDKRIALRKKKECVVSTASQSKKHPNLDEDEKINKLVREYSASTDLVSVDWKKMKIPPVLPSSEHAWLFNLMQPLKAILQVKENLQSDLGREPTDGELAEATNMEVVELRKKMEVGRAARNKLIKVRAQIQKAKLESSFDLSRVPTEEEIIERVGISPERYHEVMRVTKPIISLHSRHSITQEELINAITDFDGVEGDKRKQPALLRLALDDVLDSLKPKESLVIRQRYGLDGKGDRTLGEIAGNLKISREMVRKHEVKALMKLKHPARVDYLRRYIH